MESSSRFRFRDLPEMENSSASSSVVSSDPDDDGSNLQSMTARGIKHLCSELLELKAASTQDFHTHIFANYSSFVTIFAQVGRVESELMQLKSHVLSQKELVNRLVDGIHSKVISEESMDLAIEQVEWDGPLLISELEARVNDVLETLDILLSENRIDEALAALELEDENLQRMEFGDDYTVEELRLYSAAISERKALLTQHLTLMAENPRISAAELQKALAGLCRLGDSHLATKLLLKYYHLRIASGVRNLKASKALLDRVYIRELSKFVFSMISQAARSVVMLYGETSLYAPQVIKWSRQETKVFAACYDKYVRSISEVSGGLSTAVEAVQFAISYCSLLETQRLVLRPYLIKHIRSCMKDVLQSHMDHVTKVIGIFTATDTWVLGRYLVSGIMNEGSSSMPVGQQPQYCLLTNSGRKFVTLLQAIAEDVSPLLALEIEGSILSGLANLFRNYIDILERAINSEINVAEKISSSITLAESVQQQVSILANLTALEQLFSSMVRSIFKGATDTDCELSKGHPYSYQQKEIDSCILFIQEASLGLRALFCEKFIHRIVPLTSSYILIPEICIGGQDESCMLPSLIFQVLFLELRKLEQLSEDNVFDVDWIKELLGELVEAIFLWISTNKEIWNTYEENMTVEHPLSFEKQFVLDVQFLVEITNYGGYFSTNPFFLMNLMKSAFISVGLDPRRDINDDAWAIHAAAETIQKLLEIEKKLNAASKEEVEDQPINAAGSFPDDANSSVEDDAATDELEDVCNAGLKFLNTEEYKNQSKNEANSFPEDDRSCLKGDVEPGEDDIASYIKEVPFNAEAGSLDEAVEDAVCLYNQEVAFCAETSVSYDQEVPFIAETRSSLGDDPSESKYATGSSENDAVGPSENSMQSEEDVVAGYHPRVAFKAKIESVNESSTVSEVRRDSSEGITTNITDTSLESEDTGLQSAPKMTVDILQIVDVPTESKVPDEGNGNQSELNDKVMNNLLGWRQ